MPELTVQTGYQKGQTYFVRPPGPVLVGRDLEADFALFDRRASRKHFQISFEDDGYRLTDLGSRTGTIVNDRKVSRVLLGPGDRILVGQTLLIFELDHDRDSMVGRELPGYRILERVGSGGMGVVYRARQLSLDRIVALKVLSRELARNQEFCRLFVQEARSAAELAHPNVVRVYDVNMNDGVAYYAMEFMAHGSVLGLCRLRGPLPFEDALDLTYQAACGLAYAHEKGVVHRDIKPSNLMIHESGIVKIVDLGIAMRLVDDEKAGSPGCLVGSPHYMSPEQGLGRPVDGRSDLYSLGATLFHLLTGSPPFRGENVRDVLLAHIRETPPDPRAIRPDTPRTLAELIRSLLAKDPSDRPQSAVALCEILTDFRGSLSRWNRSSRPRSTLRWMRGLKRAALVATVLVAGIGVGQLLGYLGREIQEQTDRIEHVRGLLRDGWQAIESSDFPRAQESLRQIQVFQGSPDEWELLRSEIDAFQAALRGAEGRTSKGE